MLASRTIDDPRPETALAATRAEIAVFAPVRGALSYAVPARLAAAVAPGIRVLVPLGTRLVTGVVLSLAAEDAGGLREIADVSDVEPALDEGLVDLCRFVAAYYRAPIGEVVRGALPAGLTQSGTPRLRLAPAGESALAGEGTAQPRATLTALARARKTGKLPAAIAAPLVAAGLLAREHEMLLERVAPRRVATARLLRAPTAEERAALGRAPRRRLVLEELAAAGDGGIDLPALRRRHPGASEAVAALVDMGLAARGEREEIRDPFRRPPEGPATPLPPNAAQAAAIAAVGASRGFAPFLLFGVTGSGKTEVYLQAIAAVLAAGRGALVLVPEISLTPQLGARFRARFGEQVAILHSGLSDGERYDGWRRLRAGSARIALGARSAVFAPVRDLGIVIVDEEHDGSFKQEEGVRYHARDVALRRAQRAGVPCVLGSATPSLESFAAAAAGRLQLLELPERPTPAPLPAVEIVDLRVHIADPRTLLSAPLAAALRETLAAGEQAILFLNRRGFSRFVVCTTCGQAARCPSCSVALVYHKRGARLACHYCGHTQEESRRCPSCHADTVRGLGLGTERIEEELALILGGARVARLDRDSAGGGGLEAILGRFGRREIDVLVGTQMVAKGHDFPGVTLVGVLLADAALSLPDFRASERTFQLLCQVAGRAGRGDRPGRVILQTYRPDHPALVAAASHDYRGFYAAEDPARAELGYPPHGRLVALRLDGPDEAVTRAAAEALGARARELALPVTLLGPAEAPLARLRGRHRWHLWLKAGERAPLFALVEKLGEVELPRGVRLVVDVDPLSAL